MNAPAALVPFRFGEDVLDVIPGAGTVNVVIRRTCEALGVSAQGQLAKLKTNPSATIKMILTVAEDGKLREVACLDLRSFPLWLAGIHPNKVKAAVRPKLIKFQREAADVLADHFRGARKSAAELEAEREAVRIKVLKDQYGNGAQIRMNPRYVATLKTKLARLGDVLGVSWTKAHGILRACFGVVSYMSADITAYDALETWIDAEIVEPIASTAKLSKQRCRPPSCVLAPTPQLKLFDPMKARH